MNSQQPQQYFFEQPSEHPYAPRAQVIPAVPSQIPVNFHDPAHNNYPSTVEHRFVFCPHCTLPFAPHNQFESSWNRSEMPSFHQIPTTQYAQMSYPDAMNGTNQQWNAVPTNNSYAYSLTENRPEAGGTWPRNLILNDANGVKTGTDEPILANHSRRGVRGARKPRGPVTQPRKAVDYQRKSTVFTEYQVERLAEQFKKNVYTAREERAALAAQIGVTEQQVKSWFLNKRRKMKTDELKEILTRNGND